MKNFNTSYCIGYFVGTTERGNYQTIAQQMKEEFIDVVV